MKLLATVLTITFASACHSTYAQVYQCLDDRERPQFSETPCGADAKLITLTPPKPGGLHFAQGDFSKVYQDNATREAKYKLQQAKRALSRQHQNLEQAQQKRHANYEKSMARTKDWKEYQRLQRAAQRDNRLFEKEKARVSKQYQQLAKQEQRMD